MNSLDYLTGPALVFLPEQGIGYYPVPEAEQPYDQAYWEKYRRMDDTEMGRALTEARAAWVASWSPNEALPASLLDVGIGGGAFCQHARCMGTDVNPVAVRWLRDNGKLWDGVCPVTSMTFWDSLEHIHNPAPLLEKCTERVFVSMPIYDSAEHILRSKHFRKDEHCWYFTHNGFLAFMQKHGFHYLGHSHMEVVIGREDIGTYAFERAGI